MLTLKEWRAAALATRMNTGWFMSCENPAFMGMELISNYLLHAKGGKFYESEIYDDDRNRNQVLAFDKQFKVQ